MDFFCDASVKCLCKTCTKGEPNKYPWCWQGGGCWLCKGELFPTKPEITPLKTCDKEEDDLVNLKKTYRHKEA